MFEIDTIESGYIMADGGAMFGAIPKRAWIRKYSCNEDNLCQLAMRCLLITSDTRRILVDLGIGNKHTSKIAYYQPHNLIDIGDFLFSKGYKHEDITDVIITHLHFDHCGYSTSSDELGHIRPSFPKANYWLSSSQWENMQTPNNLEKDSIFVDNILPVYEAGQLRLINEDIEIYPGLELQLFNGHSQGQLVPIINTKEGITAFPGDLIPTAAHISLEWISAYDICSLSSYTEKLRFLNNAVENDYTLIYCHDSITISSKVKQLNDNFKATDYKPTQSRK